MREGVTLLLTDLCLVDIHDLLLLAWSRHPWLLLDSPVLIEESCVLVNNQLLHHILPDLIDLMQWYNWLRDKVQIDGLVFPRVVEPAAVCGHDLFKAQLGTLLFGSRIYGCEINKDTLLLPCLRVDGYLVLGRNNDDVLNS